jgi:hypothetical protein
MSAISFTTIYQRLPAAGKPAKLAIAVARKLLVIANASCATKSLSRPKHSCLVRPFGPPRNDRDGVRPA